MAGNFRGVLIFVIFVVELAVTKISHPQKLMPTVILYAGEWIDDGCGQKHRGSYYLRWQHGQLFAVLASHSSQSSS